jgi:alginate O-acetyltransferase complex protein AlgI
MNFVSLEFFILFAMVLVGIGISSNPTWRKVVILSASCVFYAFWDWRFLGLLLFVTIADFYISRWLSLSDNPIRRKTFLILSLCINLSILFYFKYINWFIDTLDMLFYGNNQMIAMLHIILPIGISFYIFETISYIVDVYKGVAQPAGSLLDYAVFITFFPRLVAGPIMRAAQFLPQLAKGINLRWENFLIGGYLFGQGLMKKVIVADTLAIIADKIYSNPSLYTSATVWIGILSYSIQIYFDFSGYSDMAIGVARVFGIVLPVNFNLPYMSRSLTEFWQRWHISLSSWLRDYLYIPLGGNRLGRFRTYMNLMVTMLLGGLWHGASWNFVFWGGLHGAGLVIERAFGIKKHIENQKTHYILNSIRVLITFMVVSFSWIFFRSSSFEITKQIFSKLLFIVPSGVSWVYTPALSCLAIVFVVEIIARLKNFSYDQLDTQASYMIPLIFAQFLAAFVFAANNSSPFIYFQF